MLEQLSTQVDPPPAMPPRKGGSEALVLTVLLPLFAPSLSSSAYTQPRLHLWEWLVKPQDFITLHSKQGTAENTQAWVEGCLSLFKTAFA